MPRYGRLPLPANRHWCYTSRTLPWYTLFCPGKLKSVLTNAFFITYLFWESSFINCLFFFTFGSSFRIVFFVSLHNPFYEFMPYYIFLLNSILPIPETPFKIFIACIRPDVAVGGRSICVISPVTIILAFMPSPCGWNIFIWWVVFLSFIQNNYSIIERASAHVCQRAIW